MSRETEKRQLRAGNFTMNIGRVLSTIYLLREIYYSHRSVEKAVSYEGIEKQYFVDSVNFLAEEGYIYLRDIKNIKILPANLRVKADETLMEKLASQFGKENVKFITKPIENRSKID